MSKNAPTWHEVSHAMDDAGLDSHAWLDQIDGRFTEYLFQFIANVTDSNMIEVSRRYHTNASAHAMVAAFRNLVMAAIRDGRPTPDPDEESRIVKQISTSLFNKDKISKDFLAGFMEGQGDAPRS